MNDDIIKMWRSPKAEFGVWSATASDLDDETVSAEKIYTYRRAVEIGVAGYELTNGLLDILVSATEEYVDALKRGEKPEPRSWRLLSLLPASCCQKDNSLWMQSAYCRLQCILDYFTGMTDTHAVSTFKKMKGISLPGMPF